MLGVIFLRGLASGDKQAFVLPCCLSPDKLVLHTSNEVPDMPIRLINWTISIAYFYNHRTSPPRLAVVGRIYEENKHIEYSRIYTDGTTYATGYISMLNELVTKMGEQINKMTPDKLGEIYLLLSIHATERNVVQIADRIKRGVDVFAAGGDLKDCVRTMRRTANGWIRTPAHFEHQVELAIRLHNVMRLFGHSDLVVLPTNRGYIKMTWCAAKQLAHTLTTSLTSDASLDGEGSAVK